jgi:hypothetical protein
MNLVKRPSSKNELLKGNHSPSSKNELLIKLRQSLNTKRAYSHYEIFRNEMYRIFGLSFFYMFLHCKRFVIHFATIALTTFA